ncbi:peptide-methionine (S)-S-oxide reductase MsrA [Nitrosospira briensis]|uniref:peptide-methionine (S)-S-oxide reductase MsrA n=1 Tax=Nitrosospira briensis TaxID=35799 RepID=UPI000A4801F2|nr:peptide-methionine (S)-S-oxide reductase MsrA [Nitrosospira briensis]
MFKPFIFYAMPHAHLFRRMFDTVMMGMILVMLAACEPPGAHINASAAGPSASQHANSSAGSSVTDIAIFAGGCFWCTEADFDKMPGVISTTSGYIGGKVANPTYKQVSSGKTGHIEAVQVRFDPEKTNFAKLLAAFWPTIDPLTSNGQFCDEGSQYRSAIFYYDADQKRQAEASKAELEASGRFTQSIVTEILPATKFYPAEEYHQDYYIKNPLRYSYYRSSCGRDARLAQVWGIRK